MEGDKSDEFLHHQHGDEQQEYAYTECLRNHAASIGSYATDGCGKFTFDESNPDDGGRGSQCAACGCHRNFHRRAPIIQSRSAAHRQDAMIAVNRSSSPEKGMHSPNHSNNNSKRRFRSKFTDEQKDKMMIFADKLGWRMQRRKVEEDDEIERFCEGVGISRKVFKVWMHNHKTNTNNNSNIISGSNVDLTNNNSNGN